MSENLNDNVAYLQVKDLSDNQQEKVFIFNSSLRFNIIARLSGIKKIYQYPLFKKNKQHPRF